MALRRAQRDYQDKKNENCLSSKQMFQAFNLFFWKTKTNPKEIEPNLLNDFFVNIGKHPSKSMPPAGSVSQKLD